MNNIKLIIIISLLSLNVNSKIFSQSDSLSISGEIHFNCKGNIYVYLVDKETFKIPNTLIALDERAVLNEKEIIKWDGKDKGWSAWNRENVLGISSIYRILTN